MIRDIIRPTKFKVVVHTHRCVLRQQLEQATQHVIAGEIPLHFDDEQTVGCMLQLWVLYALQLYLHGSMD